MGSAKHIILIYDGDCVLCRHFCLFVQLRRRVDIMRYDMNNHPDRVDHYCRLGYDIDQGMIIDIDGTIYHGAMALTIVDTLIDVPYWWQRVLLYSVRKPWIARIIYPLLLSVRAVLKRIY